MIQTLKHPKFFSFKFLQLVLSNVRKGNVEDEILQKCFLDLVHIFAKQKKLHPKKLFWIKFG